jgi:cytochrome c biogenesis protein CcdA
VADVRAEQGVSRAYRNRRGDLWLALAVVLVLAGAATLASGWRSGGPAPQLHLTSTGYEAGVMAAPQPFNLTDYRGRTVVLDFMAVNCAACRTTTEQVLKPFHASHPDLAILSIDTWSDPGAGVAFGGETDQDLVRLQQQTNVPWRHARDTDQAYLKYGAVSLPKLVVVDAHGDIVYSKVGASRLDRVESVVAAASAGTAVPVHWFQLSLAGFAVSAGLLTVLSPCSVGLLPAYLGLLLEDGAASSRLRRSARAVVGGALAAAAIVAVYVALALVAWATGGALRAALPWLGPLLGLALAALGALALAGRDWGAVARRLGLGKVDGRRGFAAFGAAYALAGFACTGPVFLPLLVAGFAAGTGTGFAVLGLYVACVAGAILAAALLVAAGEDALLRRWTVPSLWLHKLSAVVLIAGGLFIAWYDARAYGVL